MERQRLHRYSPGDPARARRGVLFTYGPQMSPGPAVTWPQTPAPTPLSVHSTKARGGEGAAAAVGMDEGRGGEKCLKPEAASSQVFSASPGSTHILTPQKLLDTLKKLNKTDEEISS